MSPLYVVQLLNVSHVSPFFPHMFAMHFYSLIDIVHSREIDLTGSIGVRAELNFTSLPENTCGSSDEEIPLAALSVRKIRDKVSTLSDQDSICL